MKSIPSSKTSNRLWKFQMKKQPMELQSSVQRHQLESMPDDRYNAQTNLKEVSILTKSQSHDLVLQKRGGGLQTVSDLNPNGMPLHFTLLFPEGTKGWDQFVKHVDGKRRVTPKEFFTYHLSCRGRDGPNQGYLHMGGKLFQEWICMAWLTIENQRLEYQRRNQKALRADTYKSV